MTYQAYFDYVKGIWDEIEDYFFKASSETKRIIFRLTASPYHFWLQNIAAQPFSPEQERITREIHTESAQSSPKASSVGNGIEESGSESTKSTRASKSSVSPDTEDAKESSGHHTHDARGYPVKVSASSESEDSSNLSDAEHAPLDEQALLRLDKANLADKAQEIREKARTSIKEYMTTHSSNMSSEASIELWRLASDWGKGMTVYKALDLIPDKELCLWNDKHEVFM